MPSGLPVATTCVRPKGWSTKRPRTARGGQAAVVQVGIALPSALVDGFTAITLLRLSPRRAGGPALTATSSAASAVHHHMGGRRLPGLRPGRARPRSRARPPAFALCRRSARSSPRRESLACGAIEGQPALRHGAAMRDSPVALPVGGVVVRGVVPPSSLHATVWLSGRDEDRSRAALVVGDTRPSASALHASNTFAKGGSSPHRSRSRVAVVAVYPSSAIGQADGRMARERCDEKDFLGFVLQRPRVLDSRRGTQASACEDAR